MDEIRSQHAEPITSKRAALNRGNGRFDLHAQNAGADGAIVVAAIRRRQQDSGNLMIGFDAMRGEYGDLVAWGIIDPAKVARAALENAVSVAGMILSTDVLIAELPEPKPNGAAAAPELEY